MTSATHTYEPGSAEERRPEGNGGRSDDGERLARALGVFSVGLGLAQILAPHGVARAIGVDDDDENRKTMRAVGLPGDRHRRGTAHPTASRCVRLGTGDGGRHGSGHAGAGVQLPAQRPQPPRRGDRRGRRGDDSRHHREPAAQPGGKRRRASAAPAHHQGIRVRKAITINRPPEEVYALLAQPREPAPVHGAPRVRPRAGRPALLLEGRSPPGHDGRVDGRDRRGPAQRAHLVALDRGRAGAELRDRAIHPGARRARDRGAPRAEATTRPPVRWEPRSPS